MKSEDGTEAEVWRQKRRMPNFDTFFVFNITVNVGALRTEKTGRPPYPFLAF